MSDELVSFDEGVIVDPGADAIRRGGNWLGGPALVRALNRLAVGTEGGQLRLMCHSPQAELVAGAIAIDVRGGHARRRARRSERARQLMRGFRKGCLRDPQGSCSVDAASLRNQTARSTARTVH